MNLIFYDFEVTPNFWCLTTIEYPKKRMKQFSSDYDTGHGDRIALEHFFRDHALDIWVGYNNKHYDQYIMKAILFDMDPWDVSRFIVEQNQPGWKYSGLFGSHTMINYDCMDGYRSLKELEGFMGENIKETPIDFHTEGELSKKQIQKMFEYNQHDVEQTIHVFFSNLSNFEAIVNLVSTYGLRLTAVSRTKAQLVGDILSCTPKDFDDEWEIGFVDTLEIKKYSHIVNWFKNSNNFKDGQKLNIHVAGVPHTFGLGGVHGAVEKFHGKGLFVHVDVASMYPSIMIRYNLLSRCVTKPELFKEIYDTRIRLKKEGKKKEQAPLKIVLNTMGSM